MSAPFKNSGDSSLKSQSEYFQYLPAELQDLVTRNVRYAFGLLDNARSFAESAINYSNSAYGRKDWKFALLHLATAIELVLKARLALRHEKFLVAGNLTISDHQFEEGNFKSVDTEECIKRLKLHCDFELSDHQRRTITSLRNMRNRLVHYTDFAHGSDPLRAVMAAGLNVFIEIDTSQFADIESYGIKPISELIQALTTYDEFVSVRLSSIADRLSSAERALTYLTDECGACLQDASIIENQNVLCLFCGCSIPIRDFAESRSDESSVETCPECGRDSVIASVSEQRGTTHQCFCCGYFRGAEIKYCEYKNGRLVSVPRLHSDRRITPLSGGIGERF